MNGLWQTIIGGLAVAAVTGLTVVAYRHPTGYRRIYLPLICLVWGGWAVWFVYGLGFSSGFGQAVLETIKLNRTASIQTPSHSSASFWLFMVPAVLYGYLSFLRILPEVLHTEREDAKHGAE